MQKSFPSSLARGRKPGQEPVMGERLLRVRVREENLQRFRESSRGIGYSRIRLRTRPKSRLRFKGLWRSETTPTVQQFRKRRQEPLLRLPASLGTILPPG